MAHSVYLLVGFDAERPRLEIEPPKTLKPMYPESHYREQAAELTQNLRFISEINSACNQLGVSRTFFVLGKYLQVALHAPPGTKGGAGHRQGMKSLLRKSLDVGNPSVDIQSHGFSHRPFEKVPGRKTVKASLAGRELRVADKAKSIVLGIADASIGLRAPLGYKGGLKRKKAIDMLERQGLLYISSDLRGSAASVFAPQTSAFPRQPNVVGKKLVEMPSHGWQDTAFIVHPKTRASARFVGNRVEIEASFKRLIDNAVKISSVRNRDIFVGLTLHPWAMRRYDPKLHVFKSVMKYAKSKGVQPISYSKGFEIASAALASRKPVAAMATRKRLVKKAGKRRRI